ncbi:MAG: zinc ribbon domain-containing protein [Myxococcales bacterium]|nr:zinc ribbon domain-containing protein [Myxococcales bacterium]
MISRLVAVLLAASVLWAGAARADGPYEGQWREGPMTINVSVTSWGADCGPRPQSTTSPGGGSFSITQSGDHLTFHLRQQRSTQSCWSENRAVRRVSSSYQAGTWRIVCRTPADDSRGETGRYTIQAVGSDRLSFTDDSEYDWQLNDSRCQARIRASQSFTRVGGGTASTNPTPTPEPVRPRCTPGTPARVTLRPTSAEVQPGGEQCFSASVVDAQGCAVRGRRPTLRVASGGGSVRGLCYTAPDDAATARIVASSGDLTAEATVTVRTMDLSDLIARRSENQTLPDVGDASSETASRVSARERSEGPDLLWPGILLGGALVLVLFGVLVLRGRSRSAKTGGDLPRRRSERPAPIEASEPGVDPSMPTEDMICPSCRTGYPPGSERCAKDGTDLVPYRDFRAGDGENVCPTCGTRYPKNVKFCGKDGATLEPSA